MGGWWDKFMCGWAQALTISHSWAKLFLSDLELSFHPLKVMCKTDLALSLHIRHNPDY